MMYPTLNHIKAYQKQHEAAAQDYGQFLIRIQWAGMAATYGYYINVYPENGSFVFEIRDGQGKKINPNKGEAIQVENKFNSMPEAMIGGLLACQKIINQPSPPHRE